MDEKIKNQVPSVNRASKPKSNHQMNDKAYKELFENKEIFIEFLRTFIKDEWTERINENELIRVDKEFLLEDYRKKEADIVYRIKVKDSNEEKSDEIIVYILFELQSSVDHTMALRLLDYMVQIWKQVIKNEKLRLHSDKLPSIYPIVLYNGMAHWRAATNLEDLFLPTSEEKLIRFSYKLVDISLYTEEELLEIANTISLIVLMDQKLEKNDIEIFKKKIKKITDNKDKLPEEKFEMIINFFKITIDSRHDLGLDEETKNQIWEQLKEDKNMVHAIDRVLDKAAKIARNEGRQEGEIEGRQEGERQALNQIAIALLKENASIEFIAKITKLSPEAIIALKGAFEGETEEAK